MKKTSWLAVLIVIVLGCVVGIAGGQFLAVLIPSMRTTHTGISEIFHQPFEGKDVVRILLMGEDNTSKMRKDGYGLSDTMVVMAINTKTKEIRAISIPRDTKIDIPGHGTRKLNAANAIGGPEFARQVIQNLLGVKIDYYIEMNTAGLRSIVDLVGGVYIIVDENMHYTDHHQGLYINLHASPQKQLLNGQQAEGFVRFRHDVIGDSGYRLKDGKKVAAGRIVRQQQFIRALANRVLSMSKKRDRANFLQQAYDRKFIISDLNMKDWDGIVDYFKDINPEKIQMTVLPGGAGRINGASYWLPDYNEVPKVVAQNLLFQNPAPQVQGQQTPDQQTQQQARIEVLNGSGIAGAAHKVADQLTKAGFEVARTDNAPKTNYRNCCIIAHKGRTEPVERIAQLLRCDNIREESSSDNSVDVTVIVGRKFSEN